MDHQALLNHVRAVNRQARPMLELEAVLVESAQIDQRVADAKKELAALHEQATKERAKLQADMERMNSEAVALKAATEQARRDNGVETERLNTEAAARRSALVAAHDAFKSDLDKERRVLQAGVNELQVQATALEAQVHNLRAARDQFQQNVASTLGASL